MIEYIRCMELNLRRMDPEISKQISKHHLLIAEIELQILNLELLDLRTRADKIEEELWSMVQLFSVKTADKKCHSCDVVALLDDIRDQIGSIELEIEEKKEEIEECSNAAL